MPTHPTRRIVLAWTLASCGDDTVTTTDTSATTPPASSSSETTASPPTTSAGEASGEGTAASTSTSTSTSGTTASVLYDLGVPDLPDTPESCKVIDDMDAVGACRSEAPADSFDPEIQWIWQGPPEWTYSWLSPRVANLTDDNGDGAIDLCDTPDVVIVAFMNGGGFHEGRIFVLDGATGVEHFSIPHLVHNTCELAIGDIDADGLPEIVSCTNWGGGAVGYWLRAFEHDGTPKWEGDHPWKEFPVGFGTSIALADLDNDGDVEVLANDVVADHEGKTLWATGEATTPHSATAAADLDGDGDLEVILGRTAYHHDGTPYYSTAIGPGYPQIADLDDDPQPEVLITNADGISLLEHDGTIKYSNLKPTGDGGGPNTWNRPATIHDFDGDGVAEFALSSQNHYTVYRGDASIVWTADVDDFTGIAAGTAFDFLGDGVAEAMYADEHTMFVFDGAGAPLLQIPRSSVTVIEYPVVADIDNDGSAEIVVVSDYGKDPNMISPTVQVIRDKDDRWIQARRIWNQHTYHVTNVREDSTIPQFEPPSWQHLNTYRTNAQIEGGALCMPPVPN